MEKLCWWFWRQTLSDQVGFPSLPGLNVFSHICPVSFSNSCHVLSVFLQPGPRVTPGTCQILSFYCDPDHKSTKAFPDVTAKGTSDALVHVITNRRGSFRVLCSMSFFLFSESALCKRNNNSINDKLLSESVLSLHACVGSAVKVLMTASELLNARD